MWGRVCHEATRVRTGYLGVNSVGMCLLRIEAWRSVHPPTIIIINKDTNNLIP